MLNAGPRLADFLDSLEAQSGMVDRIELIAVDAGSTDSSMATLRSWASTSSIPTTIVDDEPVGLAQALNRGLTEAQGDWVTFSRSTDEFGPEYFAALAKFITQNSEVQLLSAQDRIRHGDSRRRKRTARNYMYDAGNQCVDLATSPRFYPYSAHSSIFHRGTLTQLGLQFDPKLHPSFADVKFTNEFVIASNNTNVGFVADAMYIQQERLGAVVGRRELTTNPDYFTVVPKRGLLSLLKIAVPDGGPVPQWLGSLILAELDRYFHSEEVLNQATSASGAVAQDFISTVREISKFIDKDQLENYVARLSEGPVSEFLLHGLHQGNWQLPYAYVAGRDPDRQAIKVAYHFSGNLQGEAFEVDGQPVEPLASKIRSYHYFEHDVLYERILWLPSGDSYQLTVGGEVLPLTDQYRGPLGTQEPPAPKEAKQVEPKKSKEEPRKETREERIRRFKFEATGWKILDLKFRNAWLICDRLHNASDSGEVLFKYLRKNRRRTNAWFVIARGTPDYDRLVAEGYGKRILSPGSLKWHAAMRRAKYLISSHMARPIVDPPDIAGRYETNFKLVFLQHGITTRDRSTWLNHRDPSLFITSTPDEQESFVGDYTPYKLTTRESKMTGLPRFDENQRIDALTPEAEKNVVLVAPTWRYWLAEPQDLAGKHARQIRDDFLESDFIQNWMTVLRSERVAKAAAANGFTLGFLPHPNLRDGQNLLQLPDHVKLYSFLDQSPQEIFAHTRLLVTDYSSIAADLAYMGRGAVYFQFDRDRIDAGGHNGRPGYFDYPTLGYGPVTYDAESAITAVTTAIENRCEVSAEYQARIDAAFPQRDGLCTQRVVEEIKNLK